MNKIRTELENKLEECMAKFGCIVVPKDFRESIVDTSGFRTEPNTDSLLGENDFTRIRSRSGKLNHITFAYDLEIESKEYELAGRPREEIERVISEKISSGDGFVENVSLSVPVEKMSAVHGKKYVYDEKLLYFQVYSGKIACLMDGSEVPCNIDHLTKLVHLSAKMLQAAKHHDGNRIMRD